MLIATKQLRRCSVEGTDAAVGPVKDVLFDGRSWKVRYLDVDTGRWLPGRRVILSPEVVRTADYAQQRLVVELTREQVKSSPPLESDLPVSRQKEAELAKYYAWGAYWPTVETPLEQADEEAGGGDPDLRSTSAVEGYKLQATDGEIGHVSDFIVDDLDGESHPWEIRYLIVNTRDWLPGRHVLIPPLWTESIDWNMRQLEVGLTREKIENSPEYRPEVPVNRQYEEVFYDYYGRPRYWTGSGHPA